MPLVSKVLHCCAEMRAGFVRATCAMPFTAVAGTPLAALADNYLGLVGGIGLFGSTGSVVILRPGLAVTSAHVVRCHGRLTAFSVAGSVELVVEAVSDRLDLAVLASPPGLGRALAVAEPRRGDRVWAMGTTTGTLPPTACGVVETTSASVCLEAECAKGPFQPGLMYAAGAGPGYSGGPVVDDAGNLVGLTEGIYTRMFGALPASWPRQPRMFAYRAGDVVAEVERLCVGVTAI